jgi:hypothetical protein
VASALLGGTALEPGLVRGFVSYPKRWYVLAVFMLLNGSNAFSWIGYAPVANYVDEYYGSEQVRDSLGNSRAKLNWIYSNQQSDPGD